MQRMITTLRSVRTHTPCITSPPLPPNFGRKAPVVGLRKATNSTSGEPHSNMDKGKEENPNEKTGDVMSHSFGEGYATRSDEEGFGGIYGGNQSIPKAPDDPVIHENHPDYDKTQGSEVKEKEKARHQTSANS
ncbi:late embryogenesis abundant protein [Trema orientale]|uniref:Late embryogenesis abundant protein n=1 Tax=Trema orientale TaxID=63057 RepID=A0A2P5FXN4_TREOI|nr:late embryogenesis abundant protein [Trema orientale]